ncbi:hypothetical protein BKA70DRAFT_1301689 [Coprinopsis sp. MPI-PUGE-AT-0042]|nr:hypothetical protein BKA70DRAFT_1301689 [Coprinopsis sp. MPI-PUGE-AT-0042]
MDAQDLILRYEKWQNAVRMEVEFQEGSLQALSPMLAVGALIAGVQAQFLSLTLEILELNDPWTGWCNRVGMFGLFAEVLGTFCGAINVFYFQRRVRRAKQALDRMEECKGNVKVLMKYIAKRREMPLPDPPGPSALQTPSNSPTSESHNDLPLNLVDKNPIPQYQQSWSNIVNADSTVAVQHTVHYHTDSDLTSMENQLDICRNISRILREVVLIGYHPPRQLLTGIDTVIERVHSITGCDSDTGAQPSSGKSDRLVDLLTARSQRRPPPSIAWFLLDAVSKSMMFLGVSCLLMSMLLYGLARVDFLGLMFASSYVVMMAVSLLIAFFGQRYI